MLCADNNTAAHVVNSIYIRDLCCARQFCLNRLKNNSFHAISKGVILSVFVLVCILFFFIFILMFIVFAIKYRE